MKYLLLLSLFALVAVSLSGCTEDLKFRVSADIPSYVIETADSFEGTTAAGEEIIVFYGVGFKECRLDIDVDGTILTNYVVYEFGVDIITLIDGEKVACVDLVEPYASSRDVSNLRILQ